MEINENQWKSMKINGNQWKSMKNNENSLISVHFGVKKGSFAAAPAAPDAPNVFWNVPSVVRDNASFQMHPKTSKTIQ